MAFGCHVVAYDPARASGRNFALDAQAFIMLASGRHARLMVERSTMRRQSFFDQRVSMWISSPRFTSASYACRAGAERNRSRFGEAR